MAVREDAILLYGFLTRKNMICSLFYLGV
ncbi:MAG: hypothetical protein ACLUIQ_01235 [Dialister invisus]